VKRRGTQYPFEDGLVPQLWRNEFAIDPRWSHIDVTVEAECFRDRNQAHGTVYKNWRAAWRLWMRNCLKWTPAPVAGLERKTPQGTWQDYAKRNRVQANAGESWERYQTRIEALISREECGPFTPNLELGG